jgi:hypothetical protein
VSVATAVEEDVENLTRTEPGRSRRKIRKPKDKQKDRCMQIYSDRTSNVTKQISYSVRPLAARNAFSLMKIIGEFMQLPVRGKEGDGCRQVLLLNGKECRC